MKRLALTAGATLISSALIAPAVDTPVLVAVLLGMIAPLAVASATWVMIEWTYRRHPDQLTPLMATALFAKMILFGAYVAVVLRVLLVRPVPFVASFTVYFIVLHLTEAFWLRRLFTTGLRASG